MGDFLMGGGPGGAPGGGASAEQAPVLTERQTNRHGMNQQAQPFKSSNTFQSNGGSGNGRPKSASSSGMQPQHAAANPNPTTMSMPQILSNDLQLSESDSD